MNGPAGGDSRQDVSIVGAGIVGLAHAYSAARRGHRVTVFERGEQAQGASIRNFGMVWPIGQPAGKAHEIAMKSRKVWLELARQAGLWVKPCGSIHLAHRQDEWAVLEEFASVAPDLGYPCELLTRDQVLKHTAGANPEGLIGGLHSTTELGVDPRLALRDLPAWLAHRWDVHFQFGATITEIEPHLAHGADGRKWSFDTLIVCTGADFETLFPELLRASGLKRCKLQMLKTTPQPAAWNLGPHLASGLTLRHYANFDVAPSLKALKNRIASENPELDRYGIHVMASQNQAGEIILGDSHEYDSNIEPFDKVRIDELILRELAQVITLPDWHITARWHGIYAKGEGQPVFEAEPLPNVLIRTGTGGAGMTMSFGLAEEFWESRS